MFSRKRRSASGETASAVLRVTVTGRELSVLEVSRAAASPGAP